MSTPTVPVTYRAIDQNGDPVAYSIVTAKLDKTDIDAGFVAPEVVIVTADEDGLAVLDLWPNAVGAAASRYRVTATNPDTGRTFLKTYIYVPNEACELHQIIMDDEQQELTAAAIAASSLRIDIAQDLTEGEREQGRENLGVAGIPADIGAVGDGVADDTVPINAAIASGRAIPPGTYIATTITFGSKARIISQAGSAKTTIKLKAGTNAGLLVAENAYTWFGNPSAAGTNGWHIEGVTLDGNAENQSPANPDLCNVLDFYSTGYTLRDVVVKNAKGHGIRSEGPQYGESASEMSPVTQNVNIDTTGRHGWWNNGPHDIDATTVYVCDASQEADNTWCGIYNDTYGSGRFFNVHPWHRSTTTNRMKWGLSSSGNSEFIACHFEGGRGQLQHRGKGDRVLGANFYGHFGSAGTPLVSFENHENQHVGCYYNGTNGTSMYAIEFKGAAAGNQISGYFNGFNVNTPFLFTSDGGMNTIKGVGYCTAGGATTFGGTKAASTDVHYDQGGTVISVRPATPLGSSSTPGLYFYGDSDTGWAQTEGANTLTMIAGAVKALTASMNGVAAGGTPPPGYSFQVGRNISGAAYSLGVISLGQVQSGVTSRADYFSSYANTHASATVPDVRHFNATQGTFGNTPTVQYGFAVDNTLTGATTNYGHYSAIPAGANRWNFYAVGTAPNYFAGDTTVAGAFNVTNTAAIAANSASSALTVTQTGAGNAFVVEDSASADSTPFVITANGTTVVGSTASFPGIFGNAAKLQVASVGVHPIQVGRFANDIFGTDIQMLKSRNTTPGGHTTVQSGDSIGALYWGGSDGTNYLPLASVLVQVDGTPGTNDMPGRLVFSTTADGASSPTERMRIDSAGNVGIGGAATAGRNLTLTKGLSGAPLSAAISSQGEIKSDVTSAAVSLFSYMYTQAAAFTLPHLMHFYADQGVIGAGSTVTNQYGAYVASTLTGATNNYGFYGNIAAGSGRYNFYANGDAPNRFIGETLVIGAAGLGYGTGAGGTVTQPTSKVTACTLNKPTGQITTAADALAAGTAATFLFNNSLIASTDAVVVSGYWGAIDPTNYRIESFVSSGGGQAAIRVTNITGASRSEALVINYSVVKGATS